MAGVKALREIALGLETTAGTAVATTTIWRGTGVLKDEGVPVFPAEDVGLYENATRFYIPKVGATVTLDEVPATFEQFPLLLAASIEAVTTGTLDTAGGGYAYQFDLPSTAANSIATMTVEAGDNQRADEMAYSYAESWTLSGAKGEALMMSAVLRGRQATDAEFTTTATLPDVEEILFQKGKLYIDATTVGTTNVANEWVGFSLAWPSGWKALFSGDGNKYFSTLIYVGHKDNEITGELVLDHSTNAEAEITAAKAGTTRLVRMLFQGSALAATDTYTCNTCRIDLAIKYTDVPELGDQDGDDILTLPFKVVWDDDASLGAEILVVNEVQTLGT